MADSFPRHSDDALENMWIHYTDYQDIDIYVEDETQEELYNELVKRMEVFGDNCRFFKVFPLRGKTKVLGLSRAMDGNRRRAFVVDGDFDFISEDEGLDSRVFVHPCYCLENYFFCEEGVCTIVKEELAGKVSEETMQAIHKIFSNEEEKELLIELFHTYAAVKKTCGNIATVSDVRKTVLENGNQVEISRNKVSREVRRLEEEATRKVERGYFYATKRELGHSLDALPEKLAIVSGKDCLMPILLIRLNKICHTNFKMDSLVYRLSRHFNLHRVESLKAFLIDQI